MKLPIAQRRKDFNDEVKVIESNIKDLSNGDAPIELFTYVQNKLDKLSKKYQYDEEIGNRRYKLYESQALICYFQNKDSEALEFINQAMLVKGSSYTRAEKLIDQINQLKFEAKDNSNADTSKLNIREERSNLVGIDGWLALFVIGLFIGTAITIYNFFTTGIGINGSDIVALNQLDSGLGDKFQVLATIEFTSIILYIILLISTIISILRKKEISKILAICCLAFGAIFTTSDYIASYTLLEQINVSNEAQEILDEVKKYAIRNVIAALIWIPYFIVSKRVENTLTQ